MNRLINNNTCQENASTVAQTGLELNDEELKNIIGGCGGHDYQEKHCGCQNDWSSKTDWSWHYGHQNNSYGYGYEGCHSHCGGLLGILGL